MPSTMRYINRLGIEYSILDLLMAEKECLKNKN